MKPHQRTIWRFSALIVLGVSGLIFLVAPLARPPQALGARPAVTMTSTDYPCPIPTQALLTVWPLTSPTTLLTQEVRLNLDQHDAFTVTTQSGIFTTAGFTANTVTVQLMPNFTHTLVAQGHVRLIHVGGNCYYGNYTVQTTVDTNFDPLVIVQQAPNMTYRRYVPLVWH